MSTSSKPHTGVNLTVPPPNFKRTTQIIPNEQQHQRNDKHNQVNKSNQPSGHSKTLVDKTLKLLLSNANQSQKPSEHDHQVSASDPTETDETNYPSTNPAEQSLNSNGSRQSLTSRIFRNSATAQTSANVGSDTLAGKTAKLVGNTMLSQKSLHLHHVASEPVTAEADHTYHSVSRSSDVQSSKSRRRYRNRSSKIKSTTSHTSSTDTEQKLSNGMDPTAEKPDCITTEYGEHNKAATITLSEMSHLNERETSKERIVEGMTNIVDAYPSTTTTATTSCGHNGWPGNRTDSKTRLTDDVVHYASGELAEANSGLTKFEVAAVSTPNTTYSSKPKYSNQTNTIANSTSRSGSVVTFTQPTELLASHSISEPVNLDLTTTMSAEVSKLADSCGLKSLPRYPVMTSSISAGSSTGLTSHVWTIPNNVSSTPSLMGLPPRTTTIRPNCGSANTGVPLSTVYGSSQPHPSLRFSHGNMQPQQPIFGTISGQYPPPSNQSSLQHRPYQRLTNASLTKHNATNTISGASHHLPAWPHVTPADLQQHNQICQRMAAVAILAANRPRRFNRAELGFLCDRAVQHAGPSMHPFDVFYRCKPSAYFDDIVINRGSLMQV